MISDARNAPAYGRAHGAGDWTLPANARKMLTMHPHWADFIDTALVVFLAVGALATFVTVVGKYVPGFARAPGLDVIVASLTWVPWVIACGRVGWVGLPAALLGQMLAMAFWCLGHELAHREAARGPRIVNFVNKTVGRFNNHVALWVTLVALPGFWFIRLLQMFLYWPLVALLGFPKYDQKEWINVSRQKFSGLVGHDLVWCLYCDWMTGVYSLGAEMLRNVESFWCPIRFYDGKKCDNCKTDFPDIADGWVQADGTMADVLGTMEAQYGEGRREWFGHPARLTVRGKALD